MIATQPHLWIPFKTTKDIYVEGKVNGYNMRYLVNSSADVTDVFNQTKAVS